MITQKQAHKIECSFDFLGIVVRELKKIQYKRRIIPFPVIYYRCGCIFHFDKDTTKQILKDLESRGIIKLHPFNGIEILENKMVL